jgi:hypothetical protein
MKFKKIVGFGDSWTWGDELMDPGLVNHPQAHPVMQENTAYRESHCFLGLLGQHYGVPTENFGANGGSQQSVIWTYLWWLEHEKLDPKECLILVGHTESTRTSFYNPHHVSYYNDPPWNRYVHSQWIHSGFEQDQNWTQMVKAHTVLTDCDQLHRLNYQQSLRFFEGQYHALNRNIMQFCTFPAPMIVTADNLIWSDQSLNSFIYPNKHLMAPNGHPNEIGHQLLCNLLIGQIKINEI